MQTSLLRVLLVLGRVSNLPTVWSNCCAAWLLAGGGPMRTLLLLNLGASALYIGGMYLNDACDAKFDAQYRPERPIPSGAISARAVWQIGLALLALGTLTLLFIGQSKLSSRFTLLTLLSILAYNIFHKRISFSPVLMAACRFFLFLAAGAIATPFLTGSTLWPAVALGLYIVGLSYVARTESKEGPMRYWPLVLLAAPLVLAWFVNAGEARSRALLLMAIAALWIAKSLRYTLFNPERAIGKTVSGLLAGIVLVDLVALGIPDPFTTTIFLGFFASALLLQRYVPAT